MATFIINGHALGDGDSEEQRQQLAEAGVTFGGSIVNGDVTAVTGGVVNGDVVLGTKHDHRK